MTPYAKTITLFPILCFAVSFGIIGFVYRKKLTLYRKSARGGKTTGTGSYDRLRGGNRSSTLPVPGDGTLAEEGDWELNEKEEVEGAEEGRDAAILEDEDGGSIASITSTSTSTSDPEYMPQHTGSAYLQDGIVIPASPIIPAWERRLNRRIEQGRGIGAWVDWVVDRAVLRYQGMVTESEVEVQSAEG